MTREQWVPIPNHDGYLVSNQGGVKSTMGALSPQPNGKYGYRKVQLGRGNQVYVHRLVAAAFVAPIDGMDVDHRDGDVCNNAASNLRVVTHAENMALQRERKPLCKRGHAFAIFGRWTPNGRRECGECRRLREAGRKRVRPSGRTAA